MKINPFLVIFLFYFSLNQLQAYENWSSLPGRPWSIHFQNTEISQYHKSFNPPYSGENSLSDQAEFKTSSTSTLFIARKLWKNAGIYFNPELLAGEGFSGTHGIAGFPNGEIFRVDNAKATLNISRVYLKQIIGFGPETETIEAGQNQLARLIETHRLTLVLGKFSLVDFFDSNTYSHDPRTQFMNWTLMDNGAWDYPADTRGYTWGFYIEYQEPSWAIRFAAVTEPRRANELDQDTDFIEAHGSNLEFESRYQIAGRTGKARFLTYLSQADMGSYALALADAEGDPDITLTRSYRVKYGFGINLEQEISSDLGLFSRMGWNNGTTETWTFTEVDRTFSIGASLKGRQWNRRQDTLGLAFMINGISRPHAQYLAAGGLGFLLGDGRLKYGPEQTLETYYSFQPTPALSLTLDYQWINNLAYNIDRGSISVFSGRIHLEF